MITHNTIVTLEYRVSDPYGHIIDEGKEPIIYIHGGYDQIFPTVEQALDGKNLGDTFRIEVPAADAFGEYDKGLVLIEPLIDLPEDIEEGMMIDGYMEDDPDNAVLYRVTEIREGRAVLDGNHPFAGLDLVFEGVVREIVPATEDTIKTLLEQHHEHEH